MTQAEPQFLASENPNPVIRVDLAGRLLYANAAAQTVLQALNVKGDVKEKQLFPKKVLDLIQKAQDRQQLQELDIQTGKKNFLLRIMPYAKRKYLNIYGFDISPRKRYQMQVAHLEEFDPLTELPNRNAMLEALREEITHAKKNQCLGALLLVNIHDFKAVNESLGHLAGDALLCAVANRLVACIPLDYHLARLGNDEFSIIRTHLIEEADASHLAQVVVDHLSTPYFIAGHEFEISVRVGITIFPHDGEQTETLLSNASMALSRAKKSQQNHYFFYRMYMSSVAQARRSLLRDLRYALSRKEFLLFYQPQISLQSNKIVGMEALIRWQHPQHGLISPGRFAKLAEETGIIIPIGEWVLLTACQQACRWHVQGFENLSLAVNVSPLQFQHNLPKLLESVLKETAIPANLLELEITEGVLINNFKEARKTLEDVHKMGCRIAIDDFGTGFSSLSYLQELPVDKIKIDKSFVVAINDQSEKVTLVDSIIALGHKLNLRVVAEGVENKLECDYLTAHHCDEAQGFYWSEPLNTEEFTLFLKRQFLQNTKND